MTTQMPSFPPSPSNPEGARILLVGSARLETDLQFLESFRPASSIEIVETKAGALAALRTSPVDVIFAEEKLSDGEACQLFEELGRLQRLGKVPVLFVLSEIPIAIQTEVARAKYPNIDGIFFRPFDEHAMMSTLFAALRKRTGSARVSGARLSVDNVLVEVLFKGAKTARKAPVGNLGRGGMFLTLEDPLPHEGDTFTFKIEAERGRKIRIEGKGVVRWIRTQALKDLPRGVGTQFTQLAGDSLRDLLDLIKNLKKGSGGKS